MQSLYLVSEMHLMRCNKVHKIVSSQRNVCINSSAGKNESMMNGNGAQSKLRIETKIVRKEQTQAIK
jgi:hypothetical protein